MSTYIAIEETDSKNVNMIIYIREVRAKMLMVASKINYHIKIDNPLYLHKSSYILYMRRKRKYYVKLKHDNFLEVTFFRLFFYWTFDFLLKSYGFIQWESRWRRYVPNLRTHSIGRIAWQENRKLMWICAKSLSPTKKQILEKGKIYENNEMKNICFKQNHSKFPY